MINDNLPSDWKSTNFGDMFDFEKKSKHKASEGKEKGNYKFFTSSNIQKKFIDDFDFDGDFLVFGTGGSASMHNPSGKFSTSTDCLVAEINNQQILTRYVYYY
ncbi:MAG: restriction endonuclease subunit S, partial [Methanosarcinaceae archaeon]|nr:restriction endonuclease subunit S [Methanosarcinaceae archaeon]